MPAVIVVVVKPRGEVTSRDVVVLPDGPPAPDLVCALVSQIVNCDPPPTFALDFFRAWCFTNLQSVADDDEMLFSLSARNRL